jgi:GTP-binding protein
LEFTIPARGLIGLRTRLLNATGGQAVMHHNFHEYAPQRGEVPTRTNGVMIQNEAGFANNYALNMLQERGVMFVDHNDPVYEGQVVGEHCRDSDIVVNSTKLKKLSNVRTTASDENIILKPIRKATLEQALEYIEDDELVEVTPSAIRLRKALLKEHDRKKAGRKTAEVVEA